MIDWAVSSIFIVIGGYVIVMNWAIFFRGLIKKKQSSWIPIIGGLFVAIGLNASPVEGLSRFLWLPFFVDWGCIPGLTHTAWFYLTGKHKE
jgi:hypothetical protein